MSGLKLPLCVWNWCLWSKRICTRIKDFILSLKFLYREWEKLCKKCKIILWLFSCSGWNGLFQVYFYIVKLITVAGHWCSRKGKQRKWSYWLFCRRKSLANIVGWLRVQIVFKICKAMHTWFSSSGSLEQVTKQGEKRFSGITMQASMWWTFTVLFCMNKTSSAIVLVYSIMATVFEGQLLTQYSTFTQEHSPVKIKERSAWKQLIQNAKIFKRCLQAAHLWIENSG